MKFSSILKRFVEKTARGESGSRSELREKDVRRIRKLYKTDLSLREIGRLYGVSGTMIHNIVKGKQWKHVK